MDQRARNCSSDVIGVRADGRGREVEATRSRRMVVSPPAARQRCIDDPCDVPLEPPESAAVYVLNQLHGRGNRRGEMRTSLAVCESDAVDDGYFARAVQPQQSLARQLLNGCWRGHAYDLTGSIRNAVSPISVG